MPDQVVQATVDSQPDTPPELLAATAPASEPKPALAGTASYPNTSPNSLWGLASTISLQAPEFFVFRCRTMHFAEFFAIFDFKNF